jgi:glutamate carboxypeptidase
MLSIPDFAEKTPDLIALLKQLVEIESPSTDKVAVDRLGAFVAEQLRHLGALVMVDEQTTAGNHVVGRWVTGAEQDGILLLCHLDTVYDLGTLAHQPCREVEDKLTGPGVYDMKASIAMLLVALAELRKKKQWPTRPITALFTSDEEIGSPTSRPLIERLAREAALVLCLEPCLEDGSLKTWRKGIGDFEIIARGVAAHAGAQHERGRNAIEELAHQVLAIQRFTDYAAGTTVNVGMISGGTRSNVVPDEARAQVDVRVKTPEAWEQIRERMESLKPALTGTSIEVKGGLNRPPMPRDERMIATFQKAQTIAASLGLKIGEGGTGGGSDANFVAPLGVPVLDGLGAQGDHAHSEREHVIISSLAERTVLLAGIVREW